MLANTMLPLKHTVHTIIWTSGNSDLMQLSFIQQDCIYNNKMVGHGAKKKFKNQIIKVGQN